MFQSGSTLSAAVPALCVGPLTFDYEQTCRTRGTISRLHPCFYGGGCISPPVHALGICRRTRHHWQFLHLDGADDGAALGDPPLHCPLPHFSPPHVVIPVSGTLFREMHGCARLQPRLAHPAPWMHTRVSPHRARDHTQMNMRPNHSREPMPGDGLRSNPAPLARHGSVPRCAK